MRLGCEWRGSAGSHWLKARVEGSRVVSVNIKLVAIPANLCAWRENLLEKVRVTAESLPLLDGVSGNRRCGQSAVLW
jgi:hypothetical protein